jgi:hypothetical protein
LQIISCFLALNKGRFSPNRSHQEKQWLFYRRPNIHKSLLQHAKMLQEGITLVRKCFTAQFADSGGLNRYPLAGGICQHWPDWAKNESRENNRQFHAALDEFLVRS